MDTLYDTGVGMLCYAGVDIFHAGADILSDGGADILSDAGMDSLILRMGIFTRAVPY